MKVRKCDQNDHRRNLCICAGAIIVWWYIFKQPSDGGVRNVAGQKHLYSTKKIKSGGMEHLANRL